jgi:hypothetical protein
MLVFWVVTPCGLVGFEGTYCSIFRAEVSVEDGGSMFFRNVGIYLQVHMVLLPRRPKSTTIFQLNWQQILKKIRFKYEEKRAFKQIKPN